MLSPRDEDRLRTRMTIELCEATTPHEILARVKTAERLGPFVYGGCTAEQYDAWHERAYLTQKKCEGRGCDVWIEKTVYWRRFCSVACQKRNYYWRRKRGIAA